MSGFLPQVRTFITTGPVAQYRLVRLNNDNTVALAQANSLGNAHVIGLTTTNTATGGTAVSVQLVGQTVHMPVVSGLSIAAGDPLYLSDSVAGYATNATTAFPVVVGVVTDASAYSPTNLYISAELKISATLDLGGSGPDTSRLTAFGPTLSLESGNGLVVGQSALVSGSNAPEDGGAGQFIWTNDTTTGQKTTDPNYDASYAGVLVVPLVTPRTGCWKRVFDAEVNAKWWGAVGNGVVDDTVAIQHALDYAMQTGVVNVRLPSGVYRITNTLQIGYGLPGELVTVVLKGAGTGAIDTAISDPTQGTRIEWDGLLDRPAINIQGGRGSGVEDLYLVYYCNVQVNAIEMYNEVYRKPDINEWIPTGAATYATAPFIGIIIDAYAGAAPADAYPAVTYPAWCGVGIPQYNKGTSSRSVIRNCAVEGFYIGVGGARQQVGNGDFDRITNCMIAYCTYGVSLSHQQGRNADLQDTIIDFCYISITNRNSGQPVGNCQYYMANCHLGGGYQVFDIGMDNSVPTIINCYGERLTRVGCLTGSGTGSMSAPLRDCHWLFDRTQVTGTANVIVPISIMEGEANIENTIFDNVYGIEWLTFGGAATKSTVQLNGCMIGNHFTRVDFPSAAHPASRGMRATGGLVIGVFDFTDGQNVGNTRCINSKAVYGPTGANAPLTGITVLNGEGANNTVYDTTCQWNWSRLEYFTAQCEGGMKCGIKDVVVTDLDVAFHMDYGSVDVGDVLWKETNVLLVTNIDGSDITARICNGYTIDTSSTVAYLTPPPADSGDWWILRGAAQSPYAPGFACTISLTAGNPVGQVRGGDGTTPVLDASLFVSPGDKILMQPPWTSFAWYGSLFPFADTPQVQSILGADVTFDRNATRTIVIPLTPYLTKDFL